MCTFRQPRTGHLRSEPAEFVGPEAPHTMAPSSNSAAAITTSQLCASGLVKICGRLQLHGRVLRRARPGNRGIIAVMIGTHDRQLHLVSAVHARRVEQPAMEKQHVARI